MSMSVVKIGTTEEFVKRAVQWLTGNILEAQQDPDKQVIIGLCGGTTPGPIYTMLSAEKDIAWERVLFFLTDERYIDMKSKDSNQRMVWETMLTHEAARARTLFPNTALALEDCVASYNERLRDLRADIVILGMGEDGHITSLFPPVGPEAYGPDHAIHTTTDHFAVHDRISVTFPILLNASHRLFLITGEKKAKALDTMRQVTEDVSLYPAQYLFDERSTWLVGP
jgi:6-phosphogluconolactonase